MKMRNLLVVSLLAAVLPSIAAAQTSPLMLGIHEYDGAGNIKNAGTDYYYYDELGRLIRGSANRQQTGINSYQTYTYDVYGNRKDVTTVGTSCAGGCPSAVTVDARNRVTNLGASYDDAGNLQSFDGFQYRYDGAGMLSRSYLPNTSVDAQYIYTAADERIAIYTGSGQWRFTLRDQENHVIREVTASQNGGSTAWSWDRDHVFGGSRLLASVLPAGRVQNYHLDHLGSPRLVTNATGAKLGYHAYYPFGDELNLGLTEPAAERLKYTGHERDDNGPLGGSLDYMHARYYGPLQGRFLSVDPGPSDLRRPQTWNRYAYAENNPIKNVDGDGRLSNPVTGEQGKGTPILHRGGGFGQIRKEQPNVKGSAGGEYEAPRAGGRTHKGVDIVAPVGTGLRAAFSGEAYEIRTNDEKLGLSVFVRGKDGIIAIYAHLACTDLQEGDMVKEGQGVGDAGRSGNVMKEQPASEDHVHFQLYGVNGKITDPEEFLNDPKKQQRYRDKEKEVEQQ